MPILDTINDCVPLIKTEHGYEELTFSINNIVTDDGELLKNMLPVPIGSILHTNKKYISSPSEDYPWTTWEQIKGKVLVGVDENDSDFNDVGKTGGSKQNTHNHFTASSFDGTGLYVSASTNVPRSRTATRNRVNISTGSKGSGTTREDSTYDETINIMQPYYTMYMWLRLT